MFTAGGYIDSCVAVDCPPFNSAGVSVVQGCTCNTGYSGNIKASNLIPFFENNCIDINDCASHPCINGACTDRVNGYVCVCNTGFTGISCSVGLFSFFPNVVTFSGGTLISVVGSGFTGQTILARISYAVYGKTGMVIKEVTKINNTLMTFSINSIDSAGFTQPLVPAAIDFLLGNEELVYNSNFFLQFYNRTQVITNAISPQQSVTTESSTIVLTGVNFPNTSFAKCFYGVSNVSAFFQNSTTFVCTIPPSNPNPDVLADKMISINLSLSGSALDAISFSYNFTFFMAPVFILSYSFFCTQVTITWSYAVVPRSNICADILSTSLPNASTCTWVAPHQLVVQYTSQFKGRSIGILAGKLTRFGSKFALSNLAADLIIPEPSQQITIVGPQTVPLCSTLSSVFFSIFENGIVLSHITWSVTFKSNNTAVSTSISGDTLQLLDLYSYSAGDILIICVAAVDSYGFKFNATHLVSFTKAKVPLIFINGGYTRTLSSYANIEIFMLEGCLEPLNGQRLDAIAEFDYCDVNYQSCVSLPSQNVEYLGQFSAKISWLDRNQPDGTLTVRVSNSTANNWSVSAFATIQSPKNRPPSISIVGADRSVSKLESVSIKLVDLNAQEYDIRLVQQTIAWMCQIRFSDSVPCKVTFNVSFNQLSAVLTIDSMANPGDFYDIKVLFGAVQATAFLEISKATSQPVLIYPAVISATGELQIIGFAPSAAIGTQLTWRCSDFFGSTIVLPNVLASTTMNVTTINSVISLIVPVGTFLGGTPYRCILSALDNNNQYIGYAMTHVQILPFKFQDGFFLSTNQFGELNINNSISATSFTGCFTCSTILPLLYTFSVLSSNGKSVVLYSGSSNKVLHAILPGGTINISVTVTNNHGQSATKFQSVTISKSNSKASSYSAAIKIASQGWNAHLTVAHVALSFGIFNVSDVGEKFFVDAIVEASSSLDCSIIALWPRFQAFTVVLADEPLSESAKRYVALSIAKVAQVVSKCIGNPPITRMDLQNALIAMTLLQSGVDSLANCNGSGNSSMATAMHSTLDAVGLLLCTYQGMYHVRPINSIGTGLASVQAQLGFNNNKFTNSCSTSMDPLCLFSNSSTLSVAILPNMNPLCVTAMTSQLDYTSFCAVSCAYKTEVIADTISPPHDVRPILGNHLPDPYSLSSSLITLKLFNTSARTFLPPLQYSVTTTFDPSVILQSGMGSGLKCATWDNTTTHWNTFGCTTTFNGSSISCACSSTSPVGIFKSCTPGFVGLKCSSLCPLQSYGQNCSFLKTCLNGATINNVNGTCMCLEGWMGNVCNIPCNSSSALALTNNLPKWGAFCANPCACQFNTTCDPITGVCSCRPGLSGVACEIIADPCLTNDCESSNTATCLAGADHVQFSCICKPGYQGIKCANEINECIVNNIYCNIGGVCNDLINGYSCMCAPGRKGPQCGSFCYGTWGQNCANNCWCQNGGDCNPISGNCSCRPNWSGSNCSELVIIPTTLAASISLLESSKGIGLAIVLPVLLFCSLMLILLYLKKRGNKIAKVASEKADVLMAEKAWAVMGGAVILPEKTLEVREVGLMKVTEIDGAVNTGGLTEFGQEMLPLIITMADVRRKLIQNFPNQTNSGNFFFYSDNGNVDSAEENAMTLTDFFTLTTRISSLSIDKSSLVLPKPNLVLPKANALKTHSIGTVNKVKDIKRNRIFINATASFKSDFASSGKQGAEILADDIIMSRVVPDKPHVISQSNASVDVSESMMVKSANVSHDLDEDRCVVCGESTGSIFDCSGCNNRVYCSTKCQRKDWATHRESCKASRRNASVKAAVNKRNSIFSKPPEIISNTNEVLIKPVTMEISAHSQEINKESYIEPALSFETVTNIDVSNANSAYLEVVKHSQETIKESDIEPAVSIVPVIYLEEVAKPDYMEISADSQDDKPALSIVPATNIEETIAKPEYMEVSADSLENVKESFIHVIPDVRDEDVYARAEAGVFSLTEIPLPPAR